MIAINVWAAAVLIVLIVSIAVLLLDYMSHRHKYEMERLKQDHEIASGPDGEN